MQAPLSPLRYPGSKAGLIEWMDSFLNKNGLIGAQFVEPYAGSASLGLGLLSRGSISSLMIFERDPLLFSFWYSVFFRTDRLVALIERYEPSLKTREELNWLRKSEVVIDDIELMGYSALLFNRTGFSGVLNSGPIGGISQTSKYTVDCRFNKPSLIERIVELSKFSSKVTVYFGDAIKALTDANNADNSNRIFYVDPPYYIQGPKLYRYFYDFSDHLKLSETLVNAEYRWLLSYDDHPAIRHFYREFSIYEPQFRYSSRVPKKEHELLYTNIPIKVNSAIKNKK